MGLRDWIVDTELDRYRSGRVFEYMWAIMFGEPAVTEPIEECDLLHCRSVSQVFICCFTNLIDCQGCPLSRNTWCCLCSGRALFFSEGVCWGFLVTSVLEYTVAFG